MLKPVVAGWGSQDADGESEIAHVVGETREGWELNEHGERSGVPWVGDGFEAEVCDACDDGVSRFGEDPGCCHFMRPGFG